MLFWHLRTKQETQSMLLDKLFNLILFKCEIEVSRKHRRMEKDTEENKHRVWNKDGEFKI